MIQCVEVRLVLVAGLSGLINLLSFLEASADAGVLLPALGGPVTRSPNRMSTRLRAPACCERRALCGRALYPRFFLHVWVVLALTLHACLAPGLLPNFTGPLALC